MTEAQTLTLTDFLLARIAEDVARVWALGGEPGREWWHVTNEWLPPLNSDAAAFAARIHPARVLSESSAKRRIIEEHSPHEQFDWLCRTCSAADSCGCVNGPQHPCPTLLALASVYADHPDFDPAWRLS